MCKQIDHFPEDADYEADASEYFLRESSFMKIIIWNIRVKLDRVWVKPQWISLAANVSSSK